MPGIVTHNKIFKESIKYLSKKKKKNYLLKSIDSLFSSQENLTAGLFGSIGPNLFDYIPSRKKNDVYGNGISFFLHNGGFEKLIIEFIERLYSYNDKNTEWAAAQRAYIYGFLSHIISDSIIHPFVFYFSGFPGSGEKKMLNYYRRQNLLFQYNIDNFYLYYEDGAKDFNFSFDEMLPFKKSHFRYILNPSIKDLLLGSFKRVYPEISKKIILLEGKNDAGMYSNSIGYLEMLPFLIKSTYWIKQHENRKFIKFLNDLYRRNIIYSDFIVPYPWRKRLSMDGLNDHKGRWQYPAGKAGIHYESINDLLRISCEKIVEVWEKIEMSLYSECDYKILDMFKFNAYTGEDNSKYSDMKISSPIRFID